MAEFNDDTLDLGIGFLDGDGCYPDDSEEGIGPTAPLGFLTSRFSAPVTTSGILDVPQGSLSLSLSEETSMIKNIQDIFELEEDQKEDEEMVTGEDDEDDEPAVDLEDQARRTEKLKGVLSILAQLWWAGSEQIDLAAEKLADAGRNPKWRIPLGDSGVFNFFLEIFCAHTLRHTLKIQVLRLVGNSCADTDENRGRIVSSNHFPFIMLQLKDISLIPFAIPVLYNICIDYEQAQQQASNLFLTKELIELISNPRFNDSKAFLGYICKLLDLMITQRVASEPENAPDDTATVLLKLAADREQPVDMEDYMGLVNTAVAYLQHEKFQKAVISQPGSMDVTLAALVDSYTRFDSYPSIGGSSMADEAKVLSLMRSNLNQVLSDVSALAEFKEAYPIVSPLTSSLRRWLLSPQLQLSICACIMLGNLARSDAACEEFVHVCQVHKPLIEVLRTAHKSQHLHAALGFLKNLALPASNKEPIGEAGIFDVLPRLWALDTLQEIQFASISLARQLTVGSFENVRKATRRLSEDKDSPANTRTNLSLLIALFDRTDVEPIRMEIARLLTSICRVSNTYTGREPQEMERIRIQFFSMHPDVGRPLSFMVSQTKWPVVRSEGWFVFALIARYPEGAKCISDLMHDVAVFAPLVELMTGKRLVEYKPVSSPSSETSPSTMSSTSPSAVASPPFSFEPHTPESLQPHAQAAEMARLDRENAMVLVSELLKNRGNEMAVMRRSLFEDLLRGGGEILMSYQEAKPTWGAPLAPGERKHRANLKIQEVAGQSFMEFSS